MHLWSLICAALLLVFTAFRWGKLGGLTKAAAVVIAALLAVYGFDLVEPPNIEHLIERAGSKLGNWTYLLVGALAFFETAAFVGFIAPGEFTIVFGGVIAGQGDIDILWLIVVVWSAAVAGDVTSYLLGRRLGRGFLERNGPRFQITEERLVQVEGFFDRHGGKTILIGRFVGVARALGPFIAGASRMRFVRFLPYDIIGAGIWAGVLCTVGYIFWQNLERVTEVVSQGAITLGFVICLVVGLIGLRNHLNRRGQVRLFDEILKLAFLITAGAGGIVTLIVLSDPVRKGNEPIFDSEAFALTDRVANQYLTDIFTFVTRLGDGPVTVSLILLSAGLLLYRKHRYESVALVAGALSIVLTTGLLKAAFDRDRPPGSMVAVDGSSFPSGHASNSVTYLALAVAFTGLLPRFSQRSVLIVLGLVMMLSIGVSRIYLQAHYLSDVLAGWGLGVGIYAIFAVAAVLVRNIRKNVTNDGQ